MLLIQMPREELNIPPRVTVGNRTRNSTATACAFVNENLLLSAAFNSKKIYLIDLKSGKGKIIDTVRARHNPDLMDYKDGMIVTSDYPFSSPDGHISIYELRNNKILYKKEISIKNTKVHGCCIINSSNVIVTSNSDHNRGNMFYNIDTDTLTKNFSDFLYYPKDTYIVGNRLFTVTSKSLPQIGQNTVIGDSILYIHDLTTFEKLDEATFHGQTDSLCISGNDVFIVVQGDDTLVHYTIENDKLTFVRRIEGFNFPHGIATIGNKIAVTNYGDNTIRVFTIDELKNYGK